MFNDTKNIVAVATNPSSDAALNIIRCSGKTIFNIYKKITKKRSNPKPNSAFVYNLYDSKGFLIDQAVVLAFRAPKSFTGENMIEFSLHGGPVVLKRLISCLVDFGCRLAEPGEFTYRAFINGKVDLVQAESINFLIRAQNQKVASLALSNISGFLSKTINRAATSLMNIIKVMEHELDFNDGEIDFTSKKENINKIEDLLFSIQQVLDSSFLLSSQQEDFRVCFAGKTNVGKSSLFNALLGNKRAITSKTAGTTRDAVSENLKIDDFGVQLIDTAGIRKKAGKTEQKGIFRSLSEIKKADVLIFVDTKNPLKEFQKNNLEHKNVVFVLNKKDSAKKQPSNQYITTSCVSLFGIKKLKRNLENKIKKISSESTSKIRFLLNVRQKKELSLFIKKLNLAKKAFSKTNDLVVVLSCLYDAHKAIQSTVRPIEKNDVLNDIFSGFCVGK